MLLHSIFKRPTLRTSFKVNTCAKAIARSKIIYRSFDRSKWEGSLSSPYVSVRSFAATHVMDRFNPLPPPPHTCTVLRKYIKRDLLKLDRLLYCL